MLGDLLGETVGLSVVGAKVVGADVGDKVVGAMVVGAMDEGAMVGAVVTGAVVTGAVVTGAVVTGAADTGEAVLADLTALPDFAAGGLVALESFLADLADWAEVESANMAATMKRMAENFMIGYSDLRGDKEKSTMS